MDGHQKYLGGLCIQQNTINGLKSHNNPRARRRNIATMLTFRAHGLHSQLDMLTSTSHHLNPLDFGQIFHQNTGALFLSTLKLDTLLAGLEEM